LNHPFSRHIRAKFVYGICQRIGIERDNLIALQNVNMPVPLLQDYFLLYAVDNVAGQGNVSDIGVMH